tara:strand:+ start:254 stop:472 length:219 start_codon:yes stop_codon:yes gene_type:complete
MRNQSITLNLLDIPTLVGHLTRQHYRPIRSMPKHQTGLGPQSGFLTLQGWLNKDNQHRFSLKFLGFLFRINK